MEVGKENTLTLTVAKICHEIANYLSILKFLEEDICFSYNAETVEFIKNIDLLSFTMDFFRNIYSNSSQSSNQFENIKNICKLKDIELAVSSQVIDKKLPGNAMNSICVILYIFAKISKTKDMINVDFINDCVVIEKNGSANVSNSIIDALNNSTCKKDIFNILAKYAKDLLNSINYNINISTEPKLIVKIWS
jgi:hypothetical protein